MGYSVVKDQLLGRLWGSASPPRRSLAIFASANLRQPKPAYQPQPPKGDSFTRQKSALESFLPSKLKQDWWRIPGSNR